MWVTILFSNTTGSLLEGEHSILGPFIVWLTPTIDCGASLSFTDGKQIPPHITHFALSASAGDTATAHTTWFPRLQRLLKIISCYQLLVTQIQKVLTPWDHLLTLTGVLLECSWSGIMIRMVSSLRDYRVVCAWQLDRQLHYQLSSSQSR